MSMTKNKKWSRLLFTLLIVVALGLALVPAATFAAPCDPHDLSPCGDLEVTIVKPDPGLQVPVGQTFWVNAAVARPYAAGTIDGVSATLHIASGSATILSDATQGGDVQLNNCNEVVDFWWKVQCTGEDDVTLYATAASTTDKPEPCDGTYSGTSKNRTVVQINRVCDPCIVVEIIECGPEDEQGYPMPAYPGESVYAVKALLHNVCDVMVCDVNANITWTGDAALVAGYPQSISVGCIFPGRAEEVGWTLMCTGGADAHFTVDASCSKPVDQTPPDCNPCDEPAIPDPCNGVCEVQKDTCVVDQVCPAAIDVEIIQIPEKVCYGCNSEFIVTAKVCEDCGETGLNNVRAEISIIGPAEIKNNGDPIQNVCDFLAPGECREVSWVLDCIGDGPVEISVYARGSDQYNNQVREDTTATVTVEQKDTLSVEVLGPADYTVYNVCEPFSVEYRITNCTGADIDTTVYAGICINNAPNVAVVGATNFVVDEPTGAMATITPCATPGAPAPTPYQVPMIWKGETCFYIPIDCICACCYVDISVPLQCVGSGVEDCGTPADEVIQCYSGMVPGQWLDEDDVIVRQMYKAHLTANLAVYEGITAEGINTFDGTEEICAVAQGESFTVVAIVANQGEATAEDVTLNIGWTGPATLLDTPEEQNIGDIGCHGAGKAIWQFQCYAEGPVTFFLDSIGGMDANYEEAIHEDNIETACPVKVQQVPLGVTIIQPITSTDFLQYECFTVKARVTNLSTNYKLDNVLATLRWDSEESGCNPCGDFELGTPNPIDVTPGADMLMPGESALVTWQVCCCSPGDVSFWIDVDAVTVFDNALNIPGDCTLDIASSINTIHQWEKGGVCCYILSPALKDYDVCHEYGDPEAYIATGQEFAVTAKLFNTGDLPFSVDTIDLFAMGWGYMGDIEVLDTSFGDLTQNPILLAPYGQEGDSIVVSFDCVCTEPGKTDILMHVEGVSVPPDGSAGVRDSCMSFVCVYQYSAAHLVVNITNIPDPIEVGSEFPVLVSVQNVGDADAWEVQAQLSVYPDGSAGVSSNDQYGSYTRDLGNIIGHTVSETAQAEWLLRCNAAGDTTITVTVTGYDEFGYEVKQICVSELDEDQDKQITCCELLLDGTPGAPIQSRFIESDSITVQQGEESNGEEEEEDNGSGNFDIELGAGWNLISSPWYVEPANRAPATLLAAIVNELNTAYGFTSCPTATGWQTYIPNGPDQILQMRDGKGYWLYMDAPAVLAIVGNAAPLPPASMPEYTVCPGWNLIGFKNGEQAKSVDAYLAGTSYATVYGFNNATGSYFQVLPGQMLQPGHGYWVSFLASGVIYP